MALVARVCTMIALSALFGCRTTANKDAAAKAAAAGPSELSGVYTCSGEVNEPQSDGKLIGTYRLYSAAGRGLLSWIRPDKSETLRDAECKLNRDQMVTSCHTIAEADSGPADKVTWTFDIDHQKQNAAILRGGMGTERILSESITCVAEAEKSLSDNRP